MTELHLNHLYTGDGKGKTTAAIGLCVRAAGTGMPVMFAQFMKGSKSGELNSLAQIPGVWISRNQRDFGFICTMSEEEKAEMKRMHENTLDVIEAFMKNQKNGLVVLDEVTYACNYQLLDEKRVLSILENPDFEVVITGRDADERIKERVDYITEMQMIRHPYEQGIQARAGIEY